PTWRHAGRWRRRRRRRPRRAVGARAPRRGRPRGERARVNGRRNYSIDPWSITERHLDLDRIGHSESIFALSNGHIGVRGNLDEGEPHDTPGSYLGGYYESTELPYAEGGYGYPEIGQSLVNVTNGKLLRLLVDDEPFDVRYGSLERHERTLD